MPRYEYNCPDCEEKFTINHQMDEEMELCPNCHKKNLVRVISYNVYSNNCDKRFVEEMTIQQRLTRHIQEIKEELKKQKEEARKEIK